MTRERDAFLTAVRPDLARAQLNERDVAQRLHILERIAGGGGASTIRPGEWTEELNGLCGGSAADLSSATYIDWGIPEQTIPVPEGADSVDISVTVAATGITASGVWLMRTVIDTVSYAERTIQTAAAGAMCSYIGGTINLSVVGKTSIAVKTVGLRSSGSGALRSTVSTWRLTASFHGSSLGAAEGPVGPTGPAALPGDPLPAAQGSFGSGTATNGAVMHPQVDFAAQTFAWLLHVNAYTMMSATTGYGALAIQVSVNGGAFGTSFTGRAQASVLANTDTVHASGVFGVAAGQTISVRTIWEGTVTAVQASGTHNRMQATPLPVTTGTVGATGPPGAGAATAWTALTVTGANWSAAGVRARTEAGDTVRLEGELTTTGSGANTLLTLPVGFRPMRTVRRAVVLLSGTTYSSRWMTITPAGVVTVDGGYGSVGLILQIDATWTLS